METAILAAENAPKVNKYQTNLDADTFQKIYETHYRPVYNYISYRINNHNDTEDLVSQIFERVIQKYGTFDPKRGVLEAWIMGIARNTVRDYLRKRKKHFLISLDSIMDFISGGSQPEEIIVTNENNKVLVKALTRLNQKERNIVALKFGAEVKNRDIAEVMGLSESNVGVILFRSLRKMRKELKKEAFEING